MWYWLNKGLEGLADMYENCHGDKCIAAMTDREIARLRANIARLSNIIADYSPPPESDSPV